MTLNRISLSTRYLLDCIGSCECLICLVCCPLIKSLFHMSSSGCTVSVLHVMYVVFQCGVHIVLIELDPIGAHHHLDGRILKCCDPERP